MQGSRRSRHSPSFPTLPPISRRSFLGGLTVAGLSLAAGVGARRASAFEPAAPPFTLGVASGDPAHNSVVLWTRIAPDPLNGGGAGSSSITVAWEVATDAGMRHVVRRGTVVARPESAHSVRVRVLGLAPNRWYWYRFRAGRDVSPIGRTRTFPPPDSDPALLRFAFVSCQHFEDGFYPAWAHLAEEDIDCVVHLGDYIYEGAATGSGVRQHLPLSETMTLADYRTRYAQYKLDPALQAAHARFPFIVTWDDHEVEDNYAGAISEDNGDLDPTNDVPPAQFLARRAAAYRAFFEHLPLPPSAQPNGPEARIFRRFNWGQLATFSVLDTRQFRSDQPCSRFQDFLPPIGDDLVIPCGGELAPDATMTGSAQEAWLLDGLRQSTRRWNIIAQQVMMAAVNYGPGIAQVLDPALTGFAIRNVDAWDGYVAQRNRLLGTVAAAGVGNVVVLTGDTHVSWVADLKTDFADPASPVVATEFVGPSVTSASPVELIPIVQAALSDPSNAHLKFFDGLFHGYVRCTVTPARWQSDYRVVDTVLTPVSGIHTLASFVVEDGAPGALPA